MTSLVLVPWGLTDWGQAGRLAARTPLPLNATGQQQAAQWGNELAGRELVAVYCGDDPTARETAKSVAARSEVRLRQVRGLEEVDLGLWEGLTYAQVESRFPKIYRRWIEDPASVCPPDGECLDAAAERLQQTLDRIARKHKGSTVAIVLGPVALALARCHLERADSGRFHRMKADEPIWYRMVDGWFEPAQAPASH
ncbi:MAG TPA: histidine phosphatase family protein [Phycisphaerae bacterium]|nr:histidine phosphatase family protein [Phycisphaerae bacterium]